MGGRDQGHGHLGGVRADQGEGDHGAGLHQHAGSLHGPLHWRKHRQDDCQGLKDSQSVIVVCGQFLFINKPLYSIILSKWIEENANKCI